MWKPHNGYGICSRPFNHSVRSWRFVVYVPSCSHVFPIDNPLLAAQPQHANQDADGRHDDADPQEHAPTQAVTMEDQEVAKKAQDLPQIHSGYIPCSIYVVPFHAISGNTWEPFLKPLSKNMAADEVQKYGVLT